MEKLPRELLKIQKGDVYIQVPIDEHENIQFVIDTLTWHLQRLKQLEENKQK